MAIKIGIDPKPFPNMTNPAIEGDVLENKEYINEDGDKKTGTFTIDEEVTTQEDLIAQIQTALEGKVAGDNISYDTCTLNLSTDGTIYKVAYLTVDENNNINAIASNVNSNSFTAKCLCNSFIAVGASGHVSTTLSNAILLGYLNSTFDRLYQLIANKDEIVTIYINVEQGGGV